MAVPHDSDPVASNTTSQATTPSETTAQAAISAFLKAHQDTHELSQAGVATVIAIVNRISLWTDHRAKNLSYTQTNRLFADLCDAVVAMNTAASMHQRQPWENPPPDNPAKFVERVAKQLSDAYGISTSAIARELISTDRQGSQLADSMALRVRSLGNAIIEFGRILGARHEAQVALYPKLASAIEANLNPEFQRSRQQELLSSGFESNQLRILATDTIGKLASAVTSAPTLSHAQHAISQDEQAFLAQAIPHGKAELDGLMPGLAIEPMQQRAVITQLLAAKYRGVMADAVKDSEVAGLSAWATMIAKEAASDFLERHDGAVATSFGFTSSNQVTSFATWIAIYQDRGFDRTVGPSAVRALEL